MTVTYKLKRAWSEYRKEIFFGFWAIPFILIIRLLKPFIWIRFGKLRSDRIGHYVYEYALTIAESEIVNNKTIDLFHSHYPVCNEQFDKMIRRRSFVRDWVKYLFLWNKAIPFGEKHNTQNNIDLDSRDLFGWLEKANVSFNFTPCEENIINEWLEKHYVKKNNFVCLLVRDNAYLPDLDIHQYRNSDINSYISACNILTDDGLTVIRMGKLMKERFTSENTKIIDYAFLEDKSDLMDIWLFANCKFCISTGSGIDAVSDIYRKPIMYINHNPLIHFHTWSDHIIVPKILSWKDTNIKLTLQEHLENTYLNKNLYDKKGIEVIDLDEEYIIEAFKERVGRVNGTWKETKDDKVRQNMFFQELASWKDFNKYHQWIHPKARIGSHWLREMGDNFFK